MIHPHTQQGLVWRWLDAGRHFLLWLFLDMPINIYQGWSKTASSFEAQIAVITTAQNLGKPLFQDYTREGRMIGFFMRLFRIAIGILVQIIILLLFIALLFLWMIMPFYIAWQIGRNSISAFTIN